MARDQFAKILDGELAQLNASHVPDRPAMSSARARLLQTEEGALMGAIDPIEDLGGSLTVDVAGPREKLQHVGRLTQRGCLPKGLTTRCDVRLDAPLFQGGGVRLPEPTATDRRIVTMTIDAEGGDDRLVLAGDAPWFSQVEGGAGDDVIDAPTRHLGFIDCGSGIDHVTASLTIDVDEDCEHVTRVG